jgi:hypothetical protein
MRYNRLGSKEAVRPESGKARGLGSRKVGCGAGMIEWIFDQVILFETFSY